MNKIKIIKKSLIISRLLISMFLMLMSVSCGVNIHNKEKAAANNNSIHFKSPNNTYKRDSLYIASTVYEFMDKKLFIFDFYKQYGISLKEVEIDVDSILYSPDSLKLFSFVIMSVPEYDDKKIRTLYYNGEDLIGYRDSKNKPWSIWYFGHYRPSGLKNYNTVRDLMRSYYLGEGQFKSDVDYYWDGKQRDTLNMNLGTNRVPIRFTYNIDNNLFWDSSIVWKKGSRIPGVYAFQTKGNVAPGNMDSPIIFLPDLQLPDSLLNLYK